MVRQILDVLGALGELASVGSFALALGTAIRELIKAREKSSHGRAREEVSLDSENDWGPDSARPPVVSAI